MSRKQEQRAEVSLKAGMGTDMSISRLEMLLPAAAGKIRRMRISHNPLRDYSG